jgi:7-cyano-7-deazaguanine synthase
VKRKSVLLLSGGLDSAANLAFCHEQDQPVLALTAAYGQKAALKEIEAARQLSQYYQVKHQVIDLAWLGGISHSSLTQDRQEIPQLRANQLDDAVLTRKTAASVWVPNRNGLLIHFAAAFAESLGAESVIVGFNREEAATFPDNSLDYLNRVTSALALSTANQVRVESYTVHWDKKQIVHQLQNLSKRFPMEFVWSCYEGREVHCGSCESCQRFIRATGRGSPES